MTKAGGGPRGPTPLLAVAAFVAAVHGAWWLASGLGPGAALFADGDSYVWLVRAGRLLAEGGWYDTTLPRANAPLGGSIHWTRPFDVLLIAFAAPLLPFLPAKAALAWAGFLISPLLHMVAAIALVWAARPILGQAAYVAGGLTTIQFGLMGYATIGHADHHILLGLAAILALGCFVRSFAPGRSGRRYAGAAGLFLAFGLWVGPEILILTGLMAAMAAVPWLVGDTGALERNVSMSGTLAGGLAAVLLIERGPAGYLEVDYDRVSIVYMTFAALLFAFWAVVRIRRRFPAGSGSPARRLAAGLAGVAAIAVVMLFLYPEAAAGPLARIDPEALPYLQMASEYQPVSDIGGGLIFLGGALFGIPWLAWRCRAEWHGPWRWVWIFVLAACLCFILLGFQWLRWLLYGGMLLAIAQAGVIGRADELIAAQFRAPRRTLVLVPSVLLLAVGPAALGLALRHAEADGQAARQARPVCDLAAMAGFLNRPPWAEAPRTILASANFGPQLLYRTPHRVLATLHHRNGSGVLDGIRILTGRDPAAARRLAATREVDLILLCPGAGADGMFTGNGGQATLHGRLLAGKPPVWLRPVKLPPGLARIFRLYEVTRG